MWKLGILFSNIGAIIVWMSITRSYEAGPAEVGWAGAGKEAGAAGGGGGE